MRVKICGITRPEDAEAAVSLGAWAIGFLLWPESKRYADPAIAAGISRALQRKVERVGVFVNQPLDEIERLVDQLGLSYVQLHGDEGPSFCAAVGQRTGARVIKALRISHSADLRDLDRYHTDLHLLDTAVKGLRGGSGETWDWSLVAQRRSRIPFVLSGGLTPANVAEGISATHPWAVDVASGVESSPGVKDLAKLRTFFEAAQASVAA
ncbi:phosphoribosylanthranilate isomerase [Candidatus Solirubrobacter pratensis]|uniref:phosphoribosylanthranilate isomerase n=1 Tax=Candidatus Solirubrobacter pratensis TaxID=1298857 RepID=UPI0004258EFF|nr:phosphoribosylanthranilate isomerase [Candidatus Solirubrobacter pratensis]